MKTITMPLSEYNKDIESAASEHKGLFYRQGVLDTIEMLSEILRHGETESELHSDPYLNGKIENILILAKQY